MRDGRRAAVMRCVVAGGRGAVGSMYGRLFAAAGADVHVVDPAAAVPDDITAPGPATRANLGRADLVLLAVPEPAALAALGPLASVLRPDAVLAQTLSVQSRFADRVRDLRTDLQVVGLNPMYAPDLPPAGRPMAFVVLRDGPRVGWLRRVLAGAGARLVPLDPHGHDRLTGAAQVLTHAAVLGFGVALARLDVDIDEISAIAPPPHASLLALLARITGGSPEVYFDIQAANPYARQARAALTTAVAALEPAALDPVAFEAVVKEAATALGPRSRRYRDVCAGIFATLPTNDMTEGTS